MTCEKCNSNMVHRDWVLRIAKTEYGKAKRIQVERVLCKTCGKISRNLGEEFLKFKHYEKWIVELAIEGSLRNYKEFEDYPSASTEKRWSQKLQCL